MIWKIAKFALISGAIYLAIALGLVFSQSPQSFTQTKGLDFDRLDKNITPMETSNFKARDGVSLAYRHYGRENNGPLVVVIHGSGAFGAAYDGLARSVAAMGAEVLLPDLRGHGENPAPRGDVSYIGQLEDDLQDLVLQHRKAGQKLVLMGHSSGGGLVVRFAGGAYGETLDRAVLLAPFLKYNAPTIRPNSGGWAHVLTRRVIGLSMLNMVGITALNHLVMIQFNIPEGIDRSMMTEAYSFRLNESYAPRRDYLADIAALPKFALIVGQEDEAFKASEFEPLMSSATDKGQYDIIESMSHLEISNSPQAINIIDNFLGILDE